MTFHGLVWNKVKQLQVCLHPSCTDGKRLLVCYILLCAVLIATRPSNLKRSARQESWEAGLSDRAATQAKCMRKQGKESNTHTLAQTHTCSLKFPKSISVSLHPALLSHYSLLYSTAPLWQPSRCFTRVKLILSGAGWVARAQTARVSRDAINLDQNSPFRCD